MEKESGICINCGGEKTGSAAGKDSVISAARFIRSFLKLPARHSICCGTCMQECIEKRAKYEKKLKDYRLYAAIFFIAIVAGGFAFSGAFPGVLLPAIIGGVFIALLPSFSYFPSFES